MRRIVFALSLVAALAACGGGKPQPAETNTTGNATDRSAVNGTSGTATPPGNLETAAAGAAQSLGTVTTAGQPIGVTGTEVVHGAETETTSTIVTPTTTTAAVETPTDTMATMKGSTGKRAVVKKKGQ